jgi:hypothetical protein
VYTAGLGITVSPTHVVAIDSNQTQRRISSSCAPGSSIRFIDAFGGVICQSDSNTTYSATCPTGQFVRSLASNGTAICGQVATSNETLSVATVGGTEVKQTTLSPRTFCGLTHVQTNSLATLHKCTVDENLDGTWTLTANGNNATNVTVTCAARCF